MIRTERVRMWTQPDTENVVEDTFIVRSRGRVFLGRNRLDELGIDGDVGTGDIEGTQVTVSCEEAERFFGMGIAGKFMEFPATLQRDGEMTIPQTAREYFGVDEGDELYLTIGRRHG